MLVVVLRRDIGGGVGIRGWGDVRFFCLSPFRVFGWPASLLVDWWLGTLRLRVELEAGVLRWWKRKGHRCGEDPVPMRLVPFPFRADEGILPVEKFVTFGVCFEILKVVEVGCFEERECEGEGLRFAG